MSLIRLVARPMLASIFIAQGIKTLRDPDAATVLAKPVTDRVVPVMHKYAPKAPTEAKTLVRVNAAVHVGAGLMLATSRFPRISSLVLAASMVPTTIAGYAFWQADDPAKRSAQREHFLKNVGLVGGLLVAGVDTEGKPGLRWRASHAADDTRKAARRAKREARLAARAAKAEVSQRAHDVLHT
jgi:putative oxidoreductase